MFVQLTTITHDQLVVNTDHILSIVPGRLSGKDGGYVVNMSDPGKGFVINYAQHLHLLGKLGINTCPDVWDEPRRRAPRRQAPDLEEHGIVNDAVPKKSRLKI